MAAAPPAEIVSLECIRVPLQSECPKLDLSENLLMESNRQEAARRLSVIVS